MINEEDYNNSKKLQKYIGESCDHYGSLYIYSIFEENIPKRGKPFNELKKTLDLSISKFGHLPLFHTVNSKVGKICNYLPKKIKVKVEEDYTKYPNEIHHSIEQICMLFGKLREDLLSNNKDQNFNKEKVKEHLDEASKLNYLPPIHYMSQAVTSMLVNLEKPKN